jgi:hypothetical protein
VINVDWGALKCGRIYPKGGGASLPFMLARIGYEKGKYVEASRFP